MIHVVGIGLDGVAGLTHKVQELVAKATLLVGSDRHLSYFTAHSAPRLVLGNLDEAIQVITQKQTQEEIVILVSGDPLFFGLGRLLLEHFSPEQLNFYPHLTSIQLAFNRIKVPWQDAKILSVHGRDLEPLITLLQTGTEKIALLTDKLNHPGAIAKLYLSLNLPIYYDFWICENLESKAEKIGKFTANEVNKLAELTTDNFAALNVVILIRTQQNMSLDLSKIPLLGIKDEDFLTFGDRPNLMTKREIRLAILGELQLQPPQVIWDLGAGTGSVAIEVARLCPQSQIYAIEKTAMGQQLIGQNCERFQIKNINIVKTNAPNNLDHLPLADRIFIGGSGGNLERILDYCKTKLTPAGMIVLALATLENINTTLTWLSANSWQCNLLQLQIARSVPIANLTRFSPLNPVTIITANPRI